MYVGLWEYICLYYYRVLPYKVRYSLYCDILVQWVSLLTAPVLFDGRTGWDAINELMYTIAGKCGWREISRSKVIGPKSTPKQRWGFLEKLPRGSDIAIGPFYVAVLLYFQMAWEYYSTIKGLYYSKQQLGKSLQMNTSTSNVCVINTPFFLQATSNLE